MSFYNYGNNSMILPGYTYKNDTVYKSSFLDGQTLGIKISLSLK